MPRTTLPRHGSTAGAVRQAVALPVSAARPATPAAPSRKLPRYPRGAAAPTLVEVRRAGIVESRHRGHVVQVNANGTVQRALGDPETPVTLRSAVKPFALVSLVDSGAADELQLSQQELAIMAASHAGEDMHVRTIHAVFRRAGISQTLLACGSVGAPLDPQTAARLARDGEEPGAIRHNCSGFHAAAILLSRHAGWSLEDYWRPEHPAQAAARTAVAAAFGISAKELRVGGDDCGVQTYAFPLVEVARAFRLLADPDLASTPGQGWIAPSLRRIRDAMMAAPEMVGGSNDMLDTLVMRRKPGRVVIKGGAESLRGIGLLGAAGAEPGARGENGARGVAIKIDDGDGYARANRAVTVEALYQLGLFDDADLRALQAQHHPVSRDSHRAIVAESIVGFELAPISELL